MERKGTAVKLCSDCYGRICPDCYGRMKRADWLTRNYWVCEDCEKVEEEVET